jgi:hypothetical protein
MDEETTEMLSPWQLILILSFPQTSLYLFMFRFGLRVSTSSHKTRCTASHDGFCDMILIACDYRMKVGLVKRCSHVGYLASQQQRSLRRAWSAGEILQPRCELSKSETKESASSMERW